MSNTDVPDWTASADISRSSSAARTNDRLQERLARAMAKKQSEGRTNSPASTTDLASGTGTPVEKSIDERVQGTIIRPSMDATPGMETSSTAVRDPEATTPTVSDNEQGNLKNSVETPGSPMKELEHVISSEVKNLDRLSLDEESQSVTPDIVVNGVKAPREAASPEEMYAYIEKIDALQAKLLYLTREAAASAHKAAATAKTGSMEKMLSERDEKIALLMEEGQKLSKTEMKHLMMIKKFRSQAIESAKLQSVTKARAENAEASLTTAEQRATRAEAATRRAEENLEASLNADRDLEALNSQKDALTATVAEMRAQLAQVTKRAENAENKAQSEALEREKRQIAELKDDLTSAKVDREISEEKLQREIRDLKASLEREKERSTSLEVKIRAEESRFESKMESLRNRAEEASSGQVGETQAKLLRQIESLQHQYSVASENWQGIEGKLLARIANVEQERDGLAHRDGELRRKIREATQKAKSAEREIERSRDAVYQLEQSLSVQTTQIQHLERELKEKQETLARATKDLEVQQQHFEADLSRRVEEEKAKWKEQISVKPMAAHRNESPMGSMRRSAGFGLGLENGISSFVPDRSQSRHSSILPQSFRNTNTPPRQNSASFQSSISGTVPDTPVSQILDQDEYFPESQTPASLGTHRGINDLVSVSTAGAGPSVQLVERMSASVRRLESEKAASKDELARLAAQRDESRNEVVVLMREVDQKRAGDDKIKALEEELRLVNERHQTTLEMLGEKSELVEELKADVADVKQMYRELVDSTMK